ncbi:hypothetical protein [Rhizobium leguminosarum]|uniref:hypothetical protein n=1 Tax=Rhizobium leguminosarum TaxID=384 RepID=UPI0012BC1A3F|nr:hypothetical protein [Rhizobium leguminosarum]WFT88412.1 hypothetical protein QA638_12760 [Rhizobium leguminosarum]
MSEVFIEITTRSRATSSMTADGDHTHVGYGPRADLQALIDKLRAQIEDAGVSVKNDLLKTDNTKGKAYQFPTIDSEWWVTISALISTTALAAPKLAEFIKTLLEIWEKTITIDKEIAKRSEYGDHYRNARIEVRVNGIVLDLKDEKKLRQKLRQLAKKQAKTDSNEED